ncbi:hypothetical protein FOA52_007980 [Chlamydomonas sp. UWO 241]|nr:hypothetical protein FOA52_007980 [Chlamydomonas sp. UWO 241]
MAIIAGLSGLGTLIPQNKGLEYYIANYPDTPGETVLGFLSYPVLLTLQLDHIYSNWYFYASLGLLAASLMACTTTKQLPVAKVAQRWRFLTTPKAVVKMGHAEVLPSARVADLGMALDAKGYQVFIQSGALYAFKGLAGRLGPIGVHAALLMVLGGTSYSGFGGYKGSVMCPEGGDFTPASYMYPASQISQLPETAKSSVHVDSFEIDYRPDGAVAQFYSTLTLTDSNTGDITTKRISVNDPFRSKGITMYQTDWSLAAVTIRLLPDGGAQAPPLLADDAAASSSAATGTSLLADGPQLGDAFRLPLASLEGKPGIAGRLWGGFLPISEPGPGGAAPKGVSVLARDPQSVVIYDSKGAFVGVRRPGSGKPIEVEGLRLVVEGITGATGLEIKHDPGVPWVYAGFGGLMITTLISYLSHSQVWACQDGSYVYVAGRSNRALIGFAKEFDEMLEAVPELPEAA